MALIPLRKAIEDLETGTAAGRTQMTHFADVLGAGGQCLGTVRFALRLSPAVLAPLRAFRQLPTSQVRPSASCAPPLLGLPLGCFSA